MSKTRNKRHILFVCMKWWLRIWILLIKLLVSDCGKKVEALLLNDVRRRNYFQVEKKGEIKAKEQAIFILSPNVKLFQFVQEASGENLGFTLALWEPFSWNQFPITFHVTSLEHFPQPSRIFLVVYVFAISSYKAGDTIVLKEIISKINKREKTCIALHSKV